MTESLSRLATAAEGMELEAALFAREGAEVGLWTAAAQAIVCPAAYERREGFAAAAKASAARGWPLVLRRTGGGAVPQGPGVLNLALCATAAPGVGIEDGYRLLTGVIRSGLGAAAPPLTAGPTEGSFCDGAWNLSIGGRKLVGTAQRWRPLGGGYRRVLAHALILTGGDISPGAEAVAAFHRDIGLPPVRPEAHVTLTEAMGPTAPGAAALARALAAAGRAALGDFHSAAPARRG